MHKTPKLPLISLHVGYMSMPVWSNLDFEYSLIHGEGWTAPRRLGEQMKRWEGILRLIPEKESASGSPPTSSSPLCWGVDARVVARWPDQDWPQVEVVRWLNDKRTGTAFNLAQGLALPGEGVIESVEGLRVHVLAHKRHAWVLKHPLGVAGRGLRFGRAGELSEEDMSWAGRQLGQGGGLVFEPRVVELKEHSLHFEITPERIVYHGVCQILSDTDGTYRGQRVDPQDAQMEALGRRWQKVLAPLLFEAQQRGYWGPLSTDGYLGRLGEKWWERPLSEVNARHTFGRLALCLGRWRPGMRYAWIHPRASEAVEVGNLPLISQTPGGATGRFRLPEWADAGGGSGTFVEVG